MQLHNKILIGLLAGACTGITVNTIAPGAAWVRFSAESIAQPAGQIFLRAMLMTVVPLVFASIALGVYGIGNVRRLGRAGGTTFLLFVLSTAVATVIGLGLVALLQPGAGIDDGTRASLLETYRDQTQTLDAKRQGFGVEMLVDIVPRNPVRAAADMQLLSVIFFSLVFGIALTLLPRQQAQPMATWLEALGAVVMKIIELVLTLAPYGVFALVYAVTAPFGWSVLGTLGWYVLLVLLGLTLHGVVTISIMVATLGGMRPSTFWKRIRACMVTAFSTSSSNATLPTTIATAEKELAIPPHVAGFVLPLGATMNMNGTALYEGMTVLFLAQVFGVSLDLGQQVVVVLMSVITAIGSAGVPGGSLPLLMGVLAIVGVPPEGIAIILGIDRLLDMARTVINVAGDLAVAVIVARRSPAASELDEPAAG